MKIFAASDLHGKLNFSIPPCDLLLLAGDLCPDFAPGTEWNREMQLQWLKSKFANWLAGQPVRRTIATLGNHDFLNPKWDDFGDLKEIFKVDEHVTLEDGTVLFVTPWSDTFGGWAWMQDGKENKKVYDRIAEHCDIIVSHQPPYKWGDKVPDYLIRINEDPDGHVGSKELRETIARVQPKAVVCGHIHNGHGTYPVNLDDGTGLDPNEHHLNVYNVSVVNEQYQRVYEPTEIIL